jgi:hypothetical protein
LISPAVDLAVGDRVAHGDVVRIGPGVVGDHALEPPAGDVVALELAQGGHERLERRVGRRPADAALEALAGQAEHRLRQVALLDLALVVGDDAGAGGQADPAALGRAEARVDLLEHGGGQRGEAVLLLRARRARRRPG